MILIVQIVLKEYFKLHVNLLLINGEKPIQEDNCTQAMYSNHEYVENIDELTFEQVEIIIK